MTEENKPLVIISGADLLPALKHELDINKGMERLHKGGYAVLASSATQNAANQKLLSEKALLDSYSVAYGSQTIWCNIIAPDQVHYLKACFEATEVGTLEEGKAALAQQLKEKMGLGSGDSKGSRRR